MALSRAPPRVTIYKDSCEMCNTAATVANPFVHCVGCGEVYHKPCTRPSIDKINATEPESEWKCEQCIKWKASDEAHREIAESMDEASEHYLYRIEGNEELDEVAQIVQERAQKLYKMEEDLRIVRGLLVDLQCRMAQEKYQKNTAESEKQDSIRRVVALNRQLDHQASKLREKDAKLAKQQDELRRIHEITRNTDI